MLSSREHSRMLGEICQITFSASQDRSVRSPLMRPMENLSFMVVDQDFKTLKTCLVFQGINKELHQPKKQARGRFTQVSSLLTWEVHPSIHYQGR